MKIKREQICLYTPVYSDRSSAEEIIERAARHGVGGVELMNFCEELSTPDRAAAARLGRLARENGLKIPCFSAAADIAADPGVVDTLLRYAEICAELGIPYLHHTIALNLYGYGMTEEEREETFLRCVEPALRICEYAASLGVRTLIEDQGFVFNGKENCLRLCALSGERIGIVADTGNILFYDERPEDFIRAAGKRVCHAHVKDYCFSATPFLEEGGYQTRLGGYLRDEDVGRGCIDFAAVKQAFAEIGYAGMYAMEFATANEPAAVDRAIDFLCS